MPRNRRDKKITLSKTKKKTGLDFKQKLICSLRESVDKYERCFVFSITNIRNNTLKDVRTEWSGSKFFLGKNRVMSMALGRNDSEEYADNLHKISKLLKNQCGLLFTNEKQEKVLDYFSNFSASDYARTGSQAENTVMITNESLSKLSHSLEGQLRALGVPTTLKKGIIQLLTENDYTVCKQGDTLNSDQVKILRMLGEEQSEFRINIIANWEKKNSKVELFSKDL